MAPRGSGTDSALLERLQAIELAAATIHEGVAASPLLDPAVGAVLTAFAAHHRAHAAAWADGPAVPDAGALGVLFPAVAAAVDGPSLLQAALAVEQALAETVLDACARLSDPDASALAARIGAVEARHRAVLAAAVGAALEVAVPAASAVPGASLL